MAYRDDDHLFGRESENDRAMLISQLFKTLDPLGEAVAEVESAWEGYLQCVAVVF